MEHHMQESLISRTFLS